MKRQFDTIKTTQFNSYKTLYDELIHRLTALNYVVTATPIPTFGQREPVIPPINPLESYKPETFNTKYMRYRSVTIMYKEHPIQISVEEETLCASIKVWDYITRTTRRYYERNYAEEWAAGTYSHYRERNKSTRSPDLTVLLKRVTNMIDKSIKLYDLRKKELADGKGKQLVY